MRIETSPTYWVRIYMTGSIEVAKQTLRRLALPGGLCVSVEPTCFIYAGGEESGFVVGLVNYPRFPAESAAQINERAQEILHALLMDTYQHSGLLMTSTETTWISRRDELGR